MEKYSQESIEELIKWFEYRELPKDMQYDAATYFPDLQKGVKALITLIRSKKNRFFHASVDQLYGIKDRLEKM